MSAVVSIRTDLPPPQSLEAEQSLLGAILLQNDAYGAAIKHVGPEDFAEPIHALIFEEAGRLITSGRKVTPITMRHAFPELKMGDDTGPTINQYLATLAAEATTIINAPDYARLIRELSMVRQIVAIAGDLQRAPRDGLNADVALRNAFEQLDSLRSGLDAKDDERATIGALARQLSERMESGEVDDGSAVPTGLADLDRHLGGGFRDGRLIVLAGRPGSGKTVMGVSTSRRIARSGYGALIFSLEMPRNDVMARFAADELARTQTPIDYRDILVGNLNDVQRRKVSEAAFALEPLPIIIDTTVGVSIFEITARAKLICTRWRHADIKPGVIVIDYLGLIRSGERYKGNKVHELGEIAKSAKMLAGETQTCVLMLAQLNRAVESRDDRRPVMSDLRDSGEVEEAADVVGLLYRPAYYDQRDPKVREGDPEAFNRAQGRKYDLEIGLDKNRLGPTSTVNLWCDVAKSAVDNRMQY